jgi:hypothetical protein
VIEAKREISDSAQGQAYPGSAKGLAAPPTECSQYPSTLNTVNLNTKNRHPSFIRNAAVNRRFVQNHRDGSSKSQGWFIISRQQPWVPSVCSIYKCGRVGVSERIRWMFAGELHFLQQPRWSSVAGGLQFASSAPKLLRTGTFVCVRANMRACA